MSDHLKPEIFTFVQRDLRRIIIHQRMPGTLCAELLYTGNRRGGLRAEYKQAEAGKQDEADNEDG